MALKNIRGQYYKITAINLLNNSVTVAIYENAEHRQEGATEFHPAIYKEVLIPNLSSLLEDYPEIDKSILSNLKVAGYKGMKEQEDYQDFIDC